MHARRCVRMYTHTHAHMYMHMYTHTLHTRPGDQATVAFDPKQNQLSTNTGQIVQILLGSNMALPWLEFRHTQNCSYTTVVKCG